MMNSPVLIVSTNWIGDAVMGMPALQQFRAEHPEAEITVLTKPGLKLLWEMHPAVNSVVCMEKPAETAGRLRPIRFTCAYIFPNSFRSAFVPWLAGIPKRVGLRGHWRRTLLTDVVASPQGHQQLEYREILGLNGDLPAPQIKVPTAALESCSSKLQEAVGSAETRTLITLLPGAARGPSKRWPPDHFMQLAQQLRDTQQALIVLGGGPDDAEVCEEIAEQAGDGVISMAGKTSIPEWAALLKISACVISNDSGGMHLATAVGTPVVGIYGLTDPAKTGPLGVSRILQKSSIRSRDIARSSTTAQVALASIQPEEVVEAAYDVLAEAGSIENRR